MIKENFIMDDEILVITEEKTSDGVRIILKGHVDIMNALLLEKKLDELMERKENNVLVNMENVNYLSSSGIKACLKMYKELNSSGGRFKIEQPSMSVKNVLHAIAFDDFML